MIVIPAIDLLGGKAVRPHQGDYAKATVYDANPASRAAGWRGQVPRLHVVDLEGAKAGRAVQVDSVRAIVDAFGPGVQIGGGVRSREAFESYRALGVERVVLGTAAVKDPALVRELARAYPGVVILAVDAKNGMVATDGWTNVSRMTALALVRAFDDIPLTRLISPSLTSASIDIASFGASAVARLVRAIAGDDDGGVEQRVPIVVVRESTGPARRDGSSRDFSNVHNKKPEQSGKGELP